MLLLLLAAALAAIVGATIRQPAAAQAAPAPAGAGFTVTPADLAFILKQIKIAEYHSAHLNQDPNDPCAALVGPGPNQIPDRLTSFGLRTVDGSCNNLFANRGRFAASDEKFPRLTAPKFLDAEGVGANFFGPGSPAVPSSSYADKNANVFDSRTRVTSNLIVDQTSTNPAAIAAAEFPVRTQGNPGLHPCTTDPQPDGTGGVPAGCVPSHQTLFIPNVTTDVGLSPPYNSVFTFFGQFFDHGVDQTVKSGKSVFVPLRDDDPLIAGPDHIRGNDDDLPANQRFMVLTRAQNQPGPDGLLGTGDDIQDATNTDTPLVDQSQTYTSHASHQVFLREYASSPLGRDGVSGTADDNGPVNTGKLLGGIAGSNGASGMATWASVKKQAHDLLGLRLVDADVTNVPMLAADPYGNFLPGDHGLPQYVTDGGLVEGMLDDPGTAADETVPVPGDVKHFDTPFLTDIAHNADPSPVDTDHNPGTPPVAPTPDDDKVASADFASQPAGTYDDEMLDAHFCAGDGRVNENIALTAVHQIFHSEHDRLVDDIKNTLTNDTSASGVAALAEWKLATGASGWNGDRLFQAARFVTEMEYQHLVFEEFARKVQPGIKPFHVYDPDVNPAIPAEFAHAVYRFGHSMLDDMVARTDEDAAGNKTDHSLKLLDAFLNPPSFMDTAYAADGTTTSRYTPEEAAGAIFMGSSDQVGNELDEFVTETLRNNLLGLPLDLPTINMTRARDAGVPPLNVLRRQIFAETNDGQLAPYTSWSDYGQHLKHPESLVNFVAAYGTHPTIRDSGPDNILKDDPATTEDESADNVTTVAAKRAAAKAIVDPGPTDTTPIPDDAADFMFGEGAWADSNGVTTTGVDAIDLWVGGLAELTQINGGLLGSTFNYVFQKTLEDLQEPDRFYYLKRTPGMNLRAQLESNSFAELVQRNTEGTHSLKADAFATADCRFELGHITFPHVATTLDVANTISGPGSVNDDPTSECNENQLLLRKPDGTIQYRSTNKVDPSGINGQAVYNGTGSVDRVFGGIDNDTVWGGLGNDILEGNFGDDVTLGGEGNDIMTDSGGDDVQKGGPGNDAIDSGLGLDIAMGGDGQDFINGGANDNEQFGGEGTDFIILGQGADAVFGDGGDDWMEGGAGQDLLQGDHGAPFFDDPAQVKPGNDVFVGQVGENDYDAEGGDDLMSQNSAIDRNAGAGGFDWAYHQYDTVGADDDMIINQLLVDLPLPVVVNRDRWQETEADSGSGFNDIIRGDDVDPAAVVGGAGFSGCDALDPAGVARITGLNSLVTTFPTPLSDLDAVSAAGLCPLVGFNATATSRGNVWAEGNILLGGGGSDTIHGRGGNDIIDGDRALRTRISVRTNPNDPTTEIGSTDLMENKPVTGTFGAGTEATATTPAMTLQQAVFAGKVDPGNLAIVREIPPAPASDPGVDTAVFAGPRASYTITIDAVNPAKVTVQQVVAPVAPQKVDDGTDTLYNVEKLQFSDQTLSIAPTPTFTPANLAFGTVNLNTNSTPRVVTLRNTGLKPLVLSGITMAGTDAAMFTRNTTAVGRCLSTAATTTLAPNATCTITVTFRPTSGGAKTANVSVASNAPGSPQTIPLTGTGAVVNSPATGTPSLTITPSRLLLGIPQPRRGSVLTANTGPITDANGKPATAAGFTYQWQTAPGLGAFTNIAGATNASFTVPATAAVGMLTGNRYRVVVRFTDNAGFAEGPLTSIATLPTIAGAP